MEKQQSLRPQDIIVALKLASSKNEVLQKELASDLGLSQAELIKCFRRLKSSQIMNDDKLINKELLLNFIEHGLPVCFPAQLGTLTKGVLTAHCHKDLKSMAGKDLDYKVVWPDKTANNLGQAFYPLYPGIVKIYRQDAKLYKNIALLDLIRMQNKKSSSKAMKLLRANFR